MTGRHYKVDGERYPSVTTVLSMLEKSGLAQWRGAVGNKEADRISKEATDYGTAVHAMVEAVNLGQYERLNEDERRFVEPYRAWHAENVSHVIAAERLIVSRRHKFAGTADGVVVMRGDHLATVIDFKTSKSDLSQREWQLQLAAYALGLEEEGIEVERRIILRIPKLTPDVLHVLEMSTEDLILDQRAFLAVLRIHQWHAAQGPVRPALGPRIRFGSRS